MSTILSVENLSSGYHGKTVISGISFTIEKSQRWAVIGPNGSGKSTLLNTVAGHVPAMCGAIYLAGVAIDSMTDRERARQMAHVPQPSGRSFPPFSVLRFATLARHPWHGLFDNPSEDDAAAVQMALDITDTLGLSSRLLTELSGGELQRVLLAAAVAQDTPLILLDEPESFMDPRHTMMMRRALSRIHVESGRTFITVLHDVDAAVSCYSHILALRDGKQIYAGPASDLSREVLQSVYDVSFETAIGQHSGRNVLLPESPI